MVARLHSHEVKREHRSPEESRDTGISTGPGLADPLDPAHVQPLGAGRRLQQLRQVGERLRLDELELQVRSRG